MSCFFAFANTKSFRKSFLLEFFLDLNSLRKIGQKSYLAELN